MTVLRGELERQDAEAPAGVPEVQPDTATGHRRNVGASPRRRMVPTVSDLRSSTGEGMVTPLKRATI
ncbi:hypothetical protein BDE18_3889 [Paracoccus pantotrophus]|uniref:Transposase n=1 Tax=Paracoccus pantotrophus TaxID=82367 RepID=A0ABX9S5N8_PARPN|nr:hypothetical protein DTW92_18880 [Paracoccus pantotrophus]RKS42959.1 hypothetical protein BDE18_3889 [Paracoccus pantotrophus]RNI15417.1 hypothetical protein EB844_17185 [Paracoccus pantotrophus]